MRCALTIALIKTPINCVFTMYFTQMVLKLWPTKRAFNHNTHFGQPTFFFVPAEQSCILSDTQFKEFLFFAKFLFKMSFYLLSDSEESWQRTLVYWTMFENYVVNIQQHKDFSHKNCYLRTFLYPKINYRLRSHSDRKNFICSWNCYNLWWTKVSTKTAFLWAAGH